MVKRRWFHKCDEDLCKNEGLRERLGLTDAETGPVKCIATPETGFDSKAYCMRTTPQSWLDECDGPEDADEWADEWFSVLGRGY